MKRLITEVYKLLYKLTRAKQFATYGAIAYITILNLITLQGLGQLMEGWLGMMRFMRVLFVFPYYIATAIAVFSINFLITRPFRNLKKEREKPPHLLPVIIYTLVCIILLLYMYFGNKI